ncbi:hypothetical protein [Leucobacter luti]|uniref:Uncharacterized protein n=1 Tax=Leucobacter luti TaxID=340320 RepID=A0A4Q7TU36_9MICO|nr:hypothetical protein [Leucobacter luti]RZT64476.1 hypothetical protein EV139_1894 [Leucobacter luti]
MSRGVRVFRGALGALVVTLLAAGSHSIAGGVITLASVVATVIVTLPICVALAGRVGSLWRLTAAVATAQFLYHWMFAGLGLVTDPAASGGIAQAPHAAHLAALQGFSPALADAGSADAAMWLGHALAACLTIALLHRGERAFVALRRALRRVVAEHQIQVPVPLARPAALPNTPAAVSLRDRLLAASAMSRRGPPRCA